MKKVVSTAAAVLVAFSFITSLSFAEVRAEGPEGNHSERRIEKKIEKKRAVRKEKKRKAIKKEMRKEERRDDRR